MKFSARDVPIKFTCSNCSREFVKKFSQFVKAGGAVKCVNCSSICAPDVGMLRAATQAAQDASAELVRQMGGISKGGDLP